MKTEVLKKMRSNQPCFGTWLSLDSPIVAELAAQCGFDWLLIDMEHGCFSEAMVLPILQAIGSRPVAVVVRVPSHDPSLIGRLLDWGADGIMAPHVCTAQEAESLVCAMCYPPGGTRGYSRTVRAYGYGLHAPETKSQPLLFVQIENIEGLKNAEAIAAVDGVDVLFVGPADLKVSLSTDSCAPDFNAALTHVAATAQARAIHSGILIRDLNEIATLLQQGFSKVAVNSDLSILREGFLHAAKAR